MQKEKDSFGIVAVGGRVILKWILKTGLGVIICVYMTQDSDQ
jgi:hypothetical protein